MAPRSEAPRRSARLRLAPARLQRRRSLPKKLAESSLAPAKFASSVGGDKRGVYAYERRFLDGVPSQAVIIDSKQSQLNRCEIALAQAITDAHPTLSLMPRVELAYQRDGIDEVYSDLTLPHRIYDGHIRAGTVNGVPVTQLEMYRAIRNATPRQRARSA